MIRATWTGAFQSSASFSNCLTTRHLANEPRISRAARTSLSHHLLFACPYPPLNFLSLSLSFSPPRVPFARMWRVNRNFRVRNNRVPFHFPTEIQRGVIFDRVEGGSREFFREWLKRWWKMCDSFLCLFSLEWNLINL